MQKKIKTNLISGQTQKTGESVLIRSAGARRVDPSGSRFRKRSAFLRIVQAGFAAYCLTHDRDCTLSTDASADRSVRS